jgi:deferrochelatase/peroxidase EfeB
MIDMNASLDLHHPAASGFLDGLQGNILKVHAREHASHNFIRFRGKPAEAREWLGDFARAHVTSAGKQARQAERFRKTGDSGTFGAPGNDLDFDDDRFGASCPYHAHIRKTNPRGDLASAAARRPPIPLAAEKGFCIARRGVAYGAGDYLTGAAPPPTGGVGLLFMSAQSDLQNFEIHQAGSDSADFAAVGVDATIGRSDSPVPQTWITPMEAQSTVADPESASRWPISSRCAAANISPCRAWSFFGGLDRI